MVDVVPSLRRRDVESNLAADRHGDIDRTAAGSGQAHAADNAEEVNKESTMRLALSLLTITGQAIRWICRRPAKRC
jgi:hypothetical protein